jgi:hypothetical protein
MITILFFPAGKKRVNAGITEEKNCPNLDRHDVRNLLPVSVSQSGGGQLLYIPL